MTPQISVLIPVYNAEKYLPQCLQSLAEQTYTDFEIIAVEDGSTDGSPEVLQSFAVRDKRLRIVRQKNAGVASARNRLLKEARGKYLAFVDADDWVKPNYLEKLYAAAETEGADIVRILFEEYNERDKSCIPCDRRYRTYAAHRPVPFTPAERLRAGQDDTQVWGKLIARALVIGWQLGFCTGAVAEDVSFEILLYLQARHIIFLNEYLYVYRVGVDTSITADKPAMARGILQNLCFLCPELERRGFALPEIYEVLLRLLVKGIRRFRRLSPDARDLEVIEKTRKMIEKYRFYCYFGPRWKYGWFVRLTNGGGMKRMIFWSRLLR